MRGKIVIFLTIVSLVACLNIGCKKRTGEIGSKNNPVRFYFMPLKEKDVYEKNETIIKDYIEKNIGLYVKTTNAPNFTALVQAFGDGKADIAFMNTLGYLMVRDWSKAEAQLLTVYGDVYKTYRGELLTRADSNINKPEDINGKVVAFSDPFSASGYLYALKFFRDNNIKPAKTMFAKGHKDAVEKLYNGEVDVVAVYHSKATPEGIQRDARSELAGQYPDIFTKLKIVALTSEIPNGPVAVRKDLPPEVRAKLINSLVEFVRTPEGRAALNDLYNVTGLVPVDDSDYNSVQKVIKDLGKNIEEMVPGGITFYRKNIDTILEH